MSYDQNHILSNDPMPIDIKAMEFLYGVNFNANPEDNTYIFSSNTAEASYNGANNRDYSNFRSTIIDREGKDIIFLIKLQVMVVCL